MNRMFRIALLCACTVTTAHAQTDTATVGQIEKLESDLTIKRLQDELAKPAQGAVGAPAPPATATPAAAASLVPPTVPPRMSAVYGMTEPDGTMHYRGILVLDGVSTPVMEGSTVGGYRVARVTRAGAELIAIAKRGKGVRVFAPAPM